MQEEKKQKPQQKMILNRFTERILMVTFPTAGCLFLLVIIDKIEPFVAVMTFATVVLITILIIIPFMEQLQSVAEYSKKVSQSIKEGKEIPLFEGSAINDEYSHIIEAINQVHDIWASKSTELKEQSLSDSAILDVLPDPLMLLGNSGEVVGANIEARNIFGKNIRGSKLADFIPDPRAIKKINEVIKGTSPRQSFEMKLSKPFSKFLLVKAESLPARAHSGAITALVFHDITEAKKLEQAQSDFVANASHELRTPLSVISGFIETLEGPAKDDKEAREKFLKIMNEQCGRMSRLIENLLSLSRIQMQIKAPESKILLKELITGLVLGLESHLSEHKMKVNIKMKNLPAILGVPSEISQVFQNLLDNAIKYGKESSTITVSSYEEDDLSKETRFIYVSVNNHGEVIPEELIPRISERFYRIDTEKTRNRSGSGLGLAIVRQILEKYGTVLQIKSNEKEGTTFTVSFPVAEDRTNSQKPSKSKDKRGKISS